MNTLLTRKVALFAAVLAIALVAAVFFAGQAYANPAAFNRTQTDPSTSALAYLTPGTATTTLTYDAGASGSTFGPDSAYLFLQYTASTTGPTLKMRVEHSQDGVDWYPGSTAINSTAINATTTMITGNFAEYQWTVSTTTDNGGSGSAARVHQSLPIETPTRFTRVKFYVPPSGGNGALWAEMVSRKQVQ